MPLRLRTLGFTALFGALLLASSTTAFAQAGGSPAPAEAPAATDDADTRAAARNAYQAGEQLFNSGDYAAAAERFQEADRLLPVPHAKYWLALSLDKGGKGFEAYGVYDQLLVDPALSRIGEERIAEVRTRHAELRKTAVGQLKLNTVPSAKVAVDGEPKGNTPIAVLLRPGAHKLLLEAEGYLTEEVDVDIAPGAALEDTLELRPVPPPAAPPAPAPVAPPAAPAPKPEARSSAPGYVLLGLTAVSAGVGGFFGVRALQQKSDYDDNPTDSQADDVEKSQLVSDIGFGAALTFGISTLVYFLYEPGPERAPAAARVQPFAITPFASERGGGASARVTF